MNQISSSLSSNEYPQIGTVVNKNLGLKHCSEYQNGSGAGSSMNDEGDIAQCNQIPVLPGVLSDDTGGFIHNEYGLSFDNSSPYGSSELRDAPSEHIAASPWGFWTVSDQYVERGLWQ